MVMQSTRQKFIEEPLLKRKIVEYVSNFLNRSWIANVEIQYSPLGTKIFLEVADPKSLLGRKGRKLELLTKMLKKDLNIKNPQISVIEVKEPFLQPRIVAKKVALGIMRGGKVRAVLYRALRQVMASGAIGVEIIADGKLGAKGARSRKLKVYAGFVPKAGDPANNVRTAHYDAVTKYGIIGITVRIATKDLYLPDKVKKEEEKKEEKEEGKNEAKGA